MSPSKKIVLTIRQESQKINLVTVVTVIFFEHPLTKLVKKCARANWCPNITAGHYSYEQVSVSTSAPSSLSLKFIACRLQTFIHSFVHFISFKQH